MIPTPTLMTLTVLPRFTILDDNIPTNAITLEVLDQFSAATTAQSKSQSGPTPASSGPGRPTTSSDETSLPSDISIPQGAKGSETEEEFMARLTAEMSSVLSTLSVDPAASASTPEDIAKMGQELEEFTQKMEAQGVKPEDILKAILGEETGNRVGEIAEEARSKLPETQSQRTSQSPGAPRTKSDEPSSSSSTSKGKPSSFEDTIRKTMERMETSSAAASSATAQASSKSEEDMLIEMLRALESESGAGSGDGSEGDLSKMFLGMMEQLTNKDMLYEPMKELHSKYPEWLQQNRSKLAPSEYERFARQRVIADEIVAKFEERDYSDDNAACREFVWEKMQAMQAEGAPPEDLVANPSIPGMGIPGLDGGEGLEEGCPTQ
jgi:peroxin-19